MSWWKTVAAIAIGGALAALLARAIIGVERT